MKSQLYAVTAILLLGSSCRMMSVPETRTPSGPYVQLKNGSKYEGSSAERSTGVFVRDKIKLGDTSFKTKDVAFYSTGGVTYANIGRKTFATQVAAGKINLYKYVSTSTNTTTTSYAGGGSTTTTSTSRHLSYYIQKGEGAPIKGLTYNHLKPMVEPKTPEFKMLEKYRRTRTVSRILGYGGLGLTVSGFAMVGSNSNSTSSLGAAFIGAGFGAFIGWAGVYASNHMRLLKTVLIADKSDKRGSHKRVK